MRPRGLPSKWVKVLPWYYTERRQTSRAAELSKALADEMAADEKDEFVETPRVTRNTRLEVTP